MVIIIYLVLSKKNGEYLMKKNLLLFRFGEDRFIYLFDFLEII